MKTRKNKMNNTVKVFTVSLLTVACGPVDYPVNFVDPPSINGDSTCAKGGAAGSTSVISIPNTGGNSNVETGGAPSTGGVAATGGANPTGGSAGSLATGGSSARSGGTESTGGETSTTGGTSSSGGSVSTGGDSGTAGAPAVDTGGCVLISTYYPCPSHKYNNCIKYMCDTKSPSAISVSVAETTTWAYQNGCSFVLASQVSPTEVYTTWYCSL